MRLTDLKCRWLDYGGQHVAIMFRCPHCQKIWLTCFFTPVISLPTVPNDYPIEWLRGSRWARVLFYEALKESGEEDAAEGCYSDVVSCQPQLAWTRTSDDFDTMSVQPSIDASASGHWHGFITNGAIV